MNEGRRWFTRHITLRPIEDGFFEVVDGHQRVRICEELGIEEIPDEYIDIQNLTRTEAKQDMQSNFIRGRINPIKQALFLQEDKDKGLTQREIAELYNIPRSTVANILRRLENLRPEIIEEQRKMFTVNISVREINQLMRLKEFPRKQLMIYNVIKKRGVPFEEVKGIADFILGMTQTTEIQLLGRWIDLGIIMDDVMQEEFGGCLKSRSYRASGFPPIGEKKEERELWAYENWTEVLEELKPRWIRDRRIDEDGYLSENWGLSEEEIEKKLYQHLKKPPLPAILRD